MTQVPFGLDHAHADREPGGQHAVKRACGCSVSFRKTAAS
jgi:hypothetical protein